MQRVPATAGPKTESRTPGFPSVRLFSADSEYEPGFLLALGSVLLQILLQRGASYGRCCAAQRIPDHARLIAEKSALAGHAYGQWNRYCRIGRV
jgi:hypothetical protein